MNLLITNTRNAQAYALLHALRPEAKKVVATVYGSSALSAHLSPAANSRYVDRVYRVPTPLVGWEHGIVQQDNTPEEETYIRRIIEICEREEIDTIFPSREAVAYVFAKNKPRFNDVGIVIPIPDFDAQTAAMDKYAVIQAAIAVGLPVPRTMLYSQVKDDLHGCLKELGLPIFIKSRVGSGPSGLAIANTADELKEKAATAARQFGDFLLQEYIPGERLRNINVLLDREGTARMTFTHENVNCVFPRYRSIGSVGQTVHDPDTEAACVALLRKLGYTGFGFGQVKMDERDGLPKLMEINTRLSLHLWYKQALGMNLPRMCIEAERGAWETHAADIPRDMLFVCPFEDLIALGTNFLNALWLKRRRSADTLTTPHPTVRGVFADYLRTYFGRRPRVYDPFFRHLLRDPLPALTHFATFAMFPLRHPKGFLG